MANTQPPIPPAGASKSKLPGCLFALLIFGAIVLIAVVGGGYLLFRSAGTIFQHGAAFVIDGIIQSVDEQKSIPADQKEPIKRTLSDLSTKVKSGEVGFERMAAITKRIAEGPFFLAVYVTAFEAQYLRQSNLPPAEVAAAQVNVRRFAQGVLTGAITNEAAGEVLSSLGKNGDGNLNLSKNSGSGLKFELRTDLSPEEIQQVLQKMKAASDQAKVPMQVPQINVAASLDQIVREELAKK